MSKESYQSDFLLGSREREKSSRDTGVDGLHDENLFDQDYRDSDGGLYNEANGKPYDNSTVVDSTYFDRNNSGSVYGPENFVGSEDVMGTIDDGDDIAAAWLAAHEGDFLTDLPSEESGSELPAA